MWPRGPHAEKSFCWAGKQLPPFLPLLLGTRSPPRATQEQRQQTSASSILASLPRHVSPHPGLKRAGTVRGFKYPSAPDLHVPWASGQRLQPWGSKALWIQLYLKLVPHRSPVGSPINIHFKPRSSQCLCFAIVYCSMCFLPRRLSEPVSVSLHLLVSLLGPCKPKPPSFCVSLDEDDAESGKQESDEPDTTDSEVCLPSSAHEVRLLGPRGMRWVCPCPSSLTEVTALRHKVPNPIPTFLPNLLLRDRYHSFQLFGRVYEQQHFSPLYSDGHKGPQQCTGPPAPWESQGSLQTDCSSRWRRWLPHMKMISCKKAGLTGNTFAPKTKLMRCRRREKEDRMPGQKVGRRRRSSWWHQLRAMTSAASRGAPARNARGQRPPSLRRGGGCCSARTPRCKQGFAQGDTYCGAWPFPATRHTAPCFGNGRISSQSSPW